MESLQQQIKFSLAVGIKKKILLCPGIYVIIYKAKTKEIVANMFLIVKKAHMRTSGPVPDWSSGGKKHMEAKGGKQ